METGSIRKSDLEGKYVFWDIDGTLAPYYPYTVKFGNTEEVLL